MKFGTEKFGVKSKIEFEFELDRTIFKGTSSPRVCSREHEKMLLKTHFFEYHNEI